MPGRSLPSGFGTVAWTWTLRVAWLTTESTAVTRPVKAVPDSSSAVIRTAPPTRTRAVSCCGTPKFT